MRKEDSSLIREKDVIRMKVPFPSIRSGLALKPHMYICYKDTNPDYGFIKCQTLKPYMLSSNTMIHYVDEPANLSRNPFVHASRIDCDKLFVTSTVYYNDELKTVSRPDVCQELFNEVKNELLTDGYITVSINEDELSALNYLIRRI
jgi:hypothetical protein